MKLYSSCRIGNPKTVHFETEVEIDDEDAFSCDHMMARWTVPGSGHTGSVRSWDSTFQESTFLYCDVDNTHTECSADWLSIDGFLDSFGQYPAVIYTSRNHLRDKVYPDRVVAARPRFHVLFPLEAPLTDEREFANHLLAIAELNPAIDRSTDTKRFYFGHPQAKVVLSQGTKDIRAHLKPRLPAQGPILSARRAIQGEQKSSDDLILKLLECAGQGLFDDYSAWIALGMALYSSGYSVDVWHSLSWKTVGHDVCRRHWKTFGGNQITAGTLYQFIREIDPKFRRVVPTGQDKLSKVLRFLARH